jgi:hypothetical protein
MAVEIADKIIKYLSGDLNWRTLEDVKKELGITNRENRIFEETVEFLAKFHLIEYDRHAAKVRISRSIHNLMGKRRR